MGRVNTTIELTVQQQSLVFVTLPPFALSVEQGLMGTIPLTVRNDGATPVTYTFVSSVPDGVPISVTLADSVYTRTILPLGEDTLDIQVIVGMGVPPAAYTIGIDLN